MPRKTTAESLSGINTGNEKIDDVLKKILLGIAENKIKMNKQEEYDDEEFVYNEYYGEYEDLGITSQSKKHINGINPRYILIIETDEDTIRIGGKAGSKSFSLSKVQTRASSRCPVVNQSTLNKLTETFGVTI